jgi:hypothetical protein
MYQLALNHLVSIRIDRRDVLSSVPAKTLAIPASTLPRGGQKTL